MMFEKYGCECKKQTVKEKMKDFVLSVPFSYYHNIHVVILNPRFSGVKNLSPHARDSSLRSE
jgi:hypothetical protein